ncbi:hypothetical protein QBC44DRAFT_98872 [Cladorrhinum sp. PSN332]|nr:hypothetical protein QBC44DRAFT_98872 [Cladorrhinum sp. PSN332]
MTLSIDLVLSPLSVLLYAAALSIHLTRSLSQVRLPRKYFFLEFSSRTSPYPPPCSGFICVPAPRSDRFTIVNREHVSSTRRALRVGVLRKAVRGFGYVDHMTEIRQSSPLLLLPADRHPDAIGQKSGSSHRCRAAARCQAAEPHNSLQCDHGRVPAVYPTSPT